MSEIRNIWRKMADLFHVLWPKPVDEFDRIHLNQLIEQYKSLSKEDIPDEIERVGAQLMELRKTSVIKSCDLYTIENILLRSIPVEQLRRTAWSLRARYRSVVNKTVYDDYRNSNPPDPKIAGEADLRADLVALLIETQKAETFNRIIAKHRYALAGRLGFLTIIFLLIVLGVLFVKAHNSLPITLTPLVFVSTAGALGGCVSALQRMLGGSPKSENANHNIVEFHQYQFGWILLRPIIGVLFAVVLFLLFCSNLITSQLFPVIKTFMKADTSQHAISDFLLETFPDTGVDFAKMIIWSFIAGFSERLVPGFLSHLTATKTDGKHEKGNEIKG